jgi:peptide/nickel transport system permease protein
MTRRSRAVSSLTNLALVVVAGGFAAAALVRFSPGFDVDENSWNPRLSASTIQAMRRAREAQSSLPQFYLRYLRGAVHGDFGASEAYRQPVSDLLRERAPITARLVAFGTGGGLVLGALFAWMAVWPRRAFPELLSVSASGMLLAIPPAALGLAFFFWQAPLSLALALAISPRVFGTIRAVLGDLYASPALLAARARGVGSARIVLQYVLAARLSQWFALVGAAILLAFGLSVPIEALCDVPGIGQLAWKAALARDLPILCALGLIVTFLAASVQSIGEIVGATR